MKNRRRIKGEHNLRYNVTIWSGNGAFDILNEISHTLPQQRMGKQRMHRMKLSVVKN